MATLPAALERFKAAQRDAHHRKAATVNFVRVLLAVTSGPAAAQAKLQRLATTPDTAIIDELTAAQYQASEPAEPEPVAGAAGWTVKWRARLSQGSAPAEGGKK